MLGVIALVASLFTLPVLTDLAPWIALVGLALMLVASVVEGLWRARQRNASCGE